MVVYNLFSFIYFLFGNNYNMFYTDKPLNVCISTSVYVEGDSFYNSLCLYNNLFYLSSFVCSIKKKV